MSDAQPYSRDRTQEFQSFCETLKNSSSSSSSSSFLSQAEFSRQASKIRLNILCTYQKLVRLSRLANRSLSVFDNPIREIEELRTSSVLDNPIREIKELTALIKQDITALNSAVVDLQRFYNTQNGSWNLCTAASSLYTTVIDNLKNRIMILVKEFKEVLITRTEKLKSDETRRPLFQPGASTEFRNPLPRVNGASSSSTRFPRIDEDMARNLANVYDAQYQLVRYRSSLSSKGWLTVKIFFVFIVYLIIFLVFVK